MSWTFTQSVNPDGYGIFMVKVWRNKGDIPLDVTFFRGVPTQIGQLTYADPFGPATAVITFPQITGYDSFASIPWLREFTNIDVYWIPATTTTYENIHGHPEQMILHPQTNLRTLYLHEYVNEMDLHTDTYSYQPAIWEGFITSISPTPTEVSVQCQGALYQLDHYYAKPLLPLRPRSVEDVIRRLFSPVQRGIFTESLNIPELEDPAWHREWTVDDEAKAYEFGHGGKRYVPLDLTVGDKWTGFITRNTGAWENILTGYVQGQLSYMYTEIDNADVSFVKGDQWTITMDPGRKPRMYVRKQSKTPDVVAYYGQPGVEANLARDGNQIVNVYFGSGKGANQSGDTQWSLMTQPTGNWSIYRPLWADDNIYHFFEDDITGFPPNASVWYARRDNNANPPQDPNIPCMNDIPTGYDADYERTHDIHVVEKMVQFPDGIDEATARKIADNWIHKDREPGWSGTIDIKVDLRSPTNDLVSKWSLRDGTVIHLKGFQGHMDPVVGVNVFHVSQVTINPQEESVQLTVDTKFRDLLTVEEAMARGRDTLAPVKSLQVGKRSALINDMIVPWNNREGSGQFPSTGSKVIFTSSFPYIDDTTKNGNRPEQIFEADYVGSGAGGPHVIGEKGADLRHLQSGGWGNNWQVVKSGKKALYVPVNAGNTDIDKRWAFFPMLLSQAGQIVRSEFAAYDRDGYLAPVEMHVSIYLESDVGLNDMPLDNSNFPGPTKRDPFAFSAFQTYDQSTGYAYPNDWNTYPANRHMIIGWGGYDAPAGYSPSRKIVATPQAPPTGMLVDGASWDYDYMGRQNFPNTQPGYDINPVDVSCTVAVYCTVPDSAANAVGFGPDGNGHPLSYYNWVYVRGRVYRNNAAS